jgi:Tfp pilus tip-associated adhesin PilY1
VYIVNLETGNVVAQLKPAAGTAPSSDPFKKMVYSIAAEPTVLDMNGDGFADVVYIGDLGGQMWKWDIHAVGIPSSSTGPVPTSVWPAKVFFESPVATIAGGLKHYHSIFQGAAAALSKGVLTLSFASGERADLGYMGDPNTSDPNNPIGLYDDNNRFWVVKDKAPVGFGSVNAFPSSLPIYETAVTGHDKLTDITTTLFDNDPNDAGYFFKVPDGQKFMTDHLIFGGVVVTLAYLPDLAGSGAGNNCALGGTTWEYAWTLDNGTGVLTAGTGSGSGSGSGTPPPLGKAMGNGAPTNPRITISRTDAGDIIVNATVQTSSGEVKHPDGLPDGFDPVQQVYWRQDF